MMNPESFKNKSGIENSEKKPEQHERHRLRRTFAAAVFALNSAGVEAGVRAEEASVPKPPSVEKVEQLQVVKMPLAEHMRFTGAVSHAGTLADYFDHGNGRVLEIPIAIEGDRPDAETIQGELLPYARGIYIGTVSTQLEFSPTNWQEQGLIAAVKGVAFFREGNNAYHMQQGDLEGYIGFDMGGLHEFTDIEDAAEREERMVCRSTHETAHAVDEHFEITDIDRDEASSVEIIKLYAELRHDEKFMELFRDGFFRENYCGDEDGHPEDSHREMFASFVVAVKDPHVVERVEELTGEYELFGSKFLELTNTIGARVNAIEALKSSGIAHRLTLLSSELSERYGGVKE